MSNTIILNNIVKYLESNGSKIIDRFNHVTDDGDELNNVIDEVFFKTEDGRIVRLFLDISTDINYPKQST